MRRGPARSPNRRRPETLEAHQIHSLEGGPSAVAAAREAAWVNPSDPARAVGPDGRPAVSRRAPIWEDVPDEKWNDWRWQLSHRVNDLEEIEQILNLTED